MKKEKIDISIKRYNRFSDYMKKKYGKKIIKISLNAGLTCPNIDGTKAYGGCIYCSNSGSGDFAGNPGDELVRQFYQIKDRMNKKWKNGLYMPYFQAYSNTYEPLDTLKAVNYKNLRAHET
jgi:radical SAM superfamily enzyme